MSAAEKFAEIEDTKAGRTIPAWRFYLVNYLLVVTFFIGRYVDDKWIAFFLVFACLIVYAVLMTRYKRRRLA